MSTSREVVPRISSKLEKEAKEYLQERELAIGDPIMVEKRGHFEHGDVQLTTNVYGVVMKNVTVYRYEVTIFGIIPYKDENKQIEFTRRTTDEVNLVLLRERCRDVFVRLQEREAGEFFMRKRCAYYDLHSILFSLDILDLGSEGLRKFIVETTEFEEDVAVHFGSVEKLIVTIRTVLEGGEKIQIGDLTTVSSNLIFFDRSLLQFLDLATSQYAMFTPSEHVTFSSKSSYLLQPGNFFRNCEVLFPDTLSYLAYGAQKGARFIEGPKANGRIASLVVDVKKTAFHAEVNLLQKVQALVRDTRRLNDSDHKKLTTALKGLTVETRHTRRYQRFQICSLCRQGANSKLIIIGEKIFTVEQYFHDKYNIYLKEPSLPLVETRRRDRQTSIYMPIELCYVADNQRVNMNQQTPSMTQITIQHCAVPPSRLREEIHTTAHSLHLFNSEWLMNACVKVIDQPLSVEARRVTTPDLEFSNNQLARVDTRNYTWNGNRYLSGAKCKIWAAYAFIESHDRLVHAEWERFLVGFVDECKRRGLQIEAPTDWQVRSTKDIDTTIRMAAENNCEFVLTVHSDNGDAAHADIKYAERVYDVVTQCIRLKTVRDVMERNRRLTLTNIANKTNIKLGGLNYTLGHSETTVEMFGTQTLFIGIGMNHPAGGLSMRGANGDQCMTSDAPPSVVGWSANIGQNNEFDFVGDFIFQAPLRDEKSNVIAEIVGRSLEYYQRGRKQNPKRVILYRNGCSEGAFRMILQYEVPMLKYVLKELGCDAKITIIVVNKMQNVRFFKKDIDKRDKAPEQNVPPGVVVDHTVVHPMFAEFHLISHRALQGTARVPKYTLVYDDNNFMMEQVEEITFHLCFGHGIVYMPTSLPSPVYIANRYAERGRMLYQRWTEHDQCNDVTYSQLSDKLCYYNSKTLFGRRINA